MERTKNDARKVEEIPPEELKDYISEFIVAVRRKDGENFQPSRLRGLIGSLNRHLKGCKYCCNIIEDKEFEQPAQWQTRDFVDFIKIFANC